MSGIPRRAIADGAITPKKLDDTILKNGRYFIASGQELPMTVAHNQPDAFFATGVDELASVLWRMGPVTVRARLTLATGDGPSKNAVGEPVDLMDQAATSDMLEYAFCSFPLSVSGHDASDPFIYTVGSSPPMMIRLKATVPVVLACEPLAVGFRVGEASAPDTIDAAGDVAAVGSELGEIWTTTNLNGDVAVETDTGEVWADTEEHEIKVVLGVASSGSGPSAGVARFFYDGVEVGAPFTFDTGDEVFPIVWAQNNQTTGAVGGVLLTELEVAYLADIDDHYVL